MIGAKARTNLENIQSIILLVVNLLFTTDRLFLVFLFVNGCFYVAVNRYRTILWSKIPGIRIQAVTRYCNERGPVGSGP